MNTAPSTLGRYVAELLAANGITTVFGIPGVHTLELYRGLADSGLTHVLVRHEQAAGFAADGYARSSGRPAAAFVISGPGVTNILTPMAQAYSDSIPMLIVASTPVRASLGKRWGVLHELPDQCALVASVLDRAHTAFCAEDVRDHIRAALASFRSGRPRPAYLEIPLDLLPQRTTLQAERFDSTAALPGAQPEEIEKAAALLRAARRPLVIAGGGARSAGAQLLDLIEALDCFLVTTAAGKGVVPEDHPGNLGASLPYRETQELVAAADVVLAVGTELSETDVYTTTKLAVSGRMIRIDVDAAKLADHYRAELAIRADAAPTLAAIGKALTPRAGWRTLLGDARPMRARIDAQFDPSAQARMRGLKAIHEALPADGAVFSDMTQIAYLGNYAFPVDRPGTWFHPSGFGTLGYALPAALGAKIATPERAVIALAGDFGLQFTLQELMTAVETQQSLPIVLWNNQALSQIRDDMIAAGIAPIAVAARNPDFPAFAAACGAASEQVANPAMLSEALCGALKRRGPTLIEATEAGFLAV